MLWCQGEVVLGEVEGLLGAHPELAELEQTFSGKELFINGVLSPEFAKLLAGPILHALAEVPEDVACLYSKDLETDVLSVCEKAIPERLP